MNEYIIITSLYINKMIYKCIVQLHDIIYTLFNFFQLW